MSTAFRDSLPARSIIRLILAVTVFGSAMTWCGLPWATSPEATNTMAAEPGGDPAADTTNKPTTPQTPTAASAEPRQAGGEPDGIVQVANLIYAGTKSSQCFADHFLIQAEQQSSISTSRRFHAIKLSSDELYNFPLVIMTGEGDFQLTDRERENLVQYVERGGFLLASAGCSSRVG